MRAMSGRRQAAGERRQRHRLKGGWPSGQMPPASAIQWLPRPAEHGYSGTAHQAARTKNKRSEVEGSFRAAAVLTACSECEGRHLR